MIKITAWTSCLISVCAFVGTAIADTKREGRELFEANCTPCHNYEKGAPADMYGQTLNLYGVIGRKAGAVKNFEYSKGIRNLGIIWNDASLDKFITSPSNFVPGTRMELPGIADGEVRQRILVYLKSLEQ